MLGESAPRTSTAPISSARSEEQTSELQSQFHLVCRLLLEKKNVTKAIYRKFYLSLHAIVRIYGYHYSCVYCSYYSSTVRLTLFSGKATDGIDGFSVMPST